MTVDNDQDDNENLDIPAPEAPKEPDLEVVDPSTIEEDDVEDDVEKEDETVEEDNTDVEESDDDVEESDDEEKKPIDSEEEDDIEEGNEEESPSDSSHEAVDDELLKSLDLDPDIYESEVVNAMSAVKKIVSTIMTENASLKQRLEQVDATVSKKDTEAWFDTFDRSVSELGIDDLGTASRDELTDEQFNARKEVLDEMNIIAKGLEASKKPALPFDKLLSKAIGSLGKVKTEPKRKAAPVTRPGKHAGTDSLTPEQRAVRNLRAKLNKFAAEEVSF